MKTLPESILEHSRRLPKGDILTPKEFLHLGSRAAVDQAFSRLAKAGLLLRAARGLYMAPCTSRQGKGVHPMEKVISALAAKRHETIVIDGARSAKMLGLTAQVPKGNRFLASGRTRTLKVGGAKIEIRHAPKWMLSFGASTAGSVIRALAWLGEMRVEEAINKLRKRLSSVDWQALSSARSILPSWMALAIGRAVK